ncbi:MAG: hypothetical protein WBB28_13900 [Crinalium sp.]
MTLPVFLDTGSINYLYNWSAIALQTLQVCKKILATDDLTDVTDDAIAN